MSNSMDNTEFSAMMMSLKGEARLFISTDSEAKMAVMLCDGLLSDCPASRMVNGTGFSLEVVDGYLHRLAELKVIIPRRKNARKSAPFFEMGDVWNEFNRELDIILF